MSARNAWKRERASTFCAFCAPAASSRAMTTSSVDVDARETASSASSVDANVSRASSASASVASDRSRIARARRVATSAWTSDDDFELVLSSSVTRWRPRARTRRKAPRF